MKRLKKWLRKARGFTLVDVIVSKTLKRLYVKTPD